MGAGAWGSRAWRWGSKCLAKYLARSKRLINKCENKIVFADATHLRGFRDGWQVSTIDIGVPKLHRQRESYADTANSWATGDSGME